MVAGSLFYVVPQYLLPTYIQSFSLCNISDSHIINRAALSTFLHVAENASYSVYAYIHTSSNITYIVEWYLLNA